MSSTLRRRRRVAATTTEFALVIPIFFAFILAMVEIGRGMMVINFMQHGARTACRSGIASGISTSAIQNTALDAMRDQGLKNITVTVKVNGEQKDASSAVSGDRITVVVSAPIASNTWLPVGRLIKGSVSGQYTLARE